MSDQTAALRMRGPRPVPAERHPCNKAGRPRAVLDPAGLILELEMAALVKRVGQTLQRRSDAGGRSFWRRLFRKLSPS